MQGMAAPNRAYKRVRFAAVSGGGAGKQSFAWVLTCGSASRPMMISKGPVAAWIIWLGRAALALCTRP
jgi:hypothetical protein